MNPDTGTNTRPCADNCGTLPSCAPLAVPYVPFQQQGSQKYDQADALANGTVFPALNLPFHLKVDAAALATDSSTQLQALLFVITELGLYLDTHQNDAEAFRLFQQYTEMARDAKEQYEALHGPLTTLSAGQDKTYRWLDGPWPWEFREGGGTD